MGSALEKKLADAGYKLSGVETKVERLILGILDSGNMRYLKAIPFLIYSYTLNLDRLYSISEKTKKKKLFAQIIGITKRIFLEEGISRELPNLDEPGNFSYDEFKKEFEQQKLSSERPNLLTEKLKISAEMDLQMWLSKIFTKKEKWIIKRMMEEKPVSRTDYEYYSRKTRKKLNSIINLQEMAATLYHKSPVTDEDLFKLKKMLEEKYGPIKGFLLQNSYLLLTLLNDKTDKPSTIKAIEIKLLAPEIIFQLEKFRQHDFV